MTKHALVADDDALVLAVLVDTLEQLGYCVFQARNGSEAISVLQSECDIDLVVTDVIMPEASGLDVFHAARRRCSEMPVVYVSGYIPTLLLGDIQRDDHAEIISKPFSIERLAAAIEEVSWVRH
jgi:CheY-like chemotaxis protein